MLTAIREAFRGNSHKQCPCFEIPFVLFCFSVLFFLVMYTLTNTFPLPCIPIVIRFVFLTSFHPPVKRIAVVTGKHSGNRALYLYSYRQRFEFSTAYIFLLFYIVL